MRTRDGCYSICPLLQTSYLACTAAASHHLCFSWLFSIAVQDRARMYTIGSLFYAIYFFVSFPAFYVMDEFPRHKWSLARAASDALAAGMLVTILLDFWRLGVGPLESAPVTGTRTEAKVLDALSNTAKSRLPWM